MNQKLLSAGEFLESLKKTDQWVMERQYKGWEPFDGNSSYLYHLTFGVNFLRQVLQQVVLRSPVNIRPLLGVVPKECTKARGYFLWAYSLLYRKTGDLHWKGKADEMFQWLTENKSPRYQEYSWGNHFNYASRAGGMPIHESTIVWTGLIGQAMFDYFDITGNERVLEVTDSACRWIMGLQRDVTPTGNCLSYVAFTESYIHNSNMIGAALLARTASHTGNAEYLEVAKEAMRYSCTRINEDGSWYYGHASKYHWVDVFHTGYNLDSLLRYIRYSGDTEFEPAMEKGYDYFKRHFFLEDGTPKYYYDRTYPIDIQCATQAIDTLALFSDRDAGALKLAEKVASWTVRNMQAADGHFVYRKWPRWTVNTPMLHWGQATMVKSLAHLFSRIES